MKNFFFLKKQNNFAPLPLMFKKEKKEKKERKGESESKEDSAWLLFFVSFFESLIWIDH